MPILVPSILVPSTGTLMFAVQAPSSHSKSTALDVTVAVKLPSSPSAFSHARLTSPSLVTVGLTLFSASNCWEMVTLCPSALAKISTSVSPDDQPRDTLLSPLPTSYLGETVMVLSPLLIILVASTVLTLMPLPAAARTLRDKSPSLLDASISKSAELRSEVSTSARADHPQAPEEPLTLPHTLLGRLAMSEVGRTLASRPNSRSRSPDLEEEDQLKVGSRPSSPPALPSLMEIESSGLDATAKAGRKKTRGDTRTILMMMEVEL
mmetsp:Transcript_12328/g.18495  ORF Transcript_12328/g.18495 Transcript_12328/m.18495 type:complete len:265 (+) Transcript_12328:228-1022(+)